LGKGLQKTDSSVSRGGGDYGNKGEKKGFWKRETEEGPKKGEKYTGKAAKVFFGKQGGG